MREGQRVSKTWTWYIVWTWYMVYVSIGHSNDVTAMCLLFSAASEGKKRLGNWNSPNFRTFVQCLTMQFQHWRCCTAQLALRFCRQLYAPLAGCIQPAQTKSLVHLNQLIARQNLSRSVQFCELIPTEHMTRLYSKLTIPHSYVSSRFQTPSLVLSLLWRRFGLAPLDNTDISQLRSRRCAGALWETQQTYATGG